MTAATATKTVSAERIEQLKAKGFYVEDMAKEYGAEWLGQFRWMRNDSDDFQDGGTSYTEADAWASADEFEAEAC